jgi:hypothetical protein
MQQQLKQAKPWFREPIAWSLLAGPIIVVIASLATYFIAIKNRDPLVVDDYYEQGKQVNMDLSRLKTAAQLGLKAEAMFSADMGAVRVILQGPTQQDDTLTLRLSHPTMAHHDQTITLRRTSAGVYEGKLTPFEAKRWYVNLSANKGHWLIEGEWRPDSGASITLDARRAAHAGKDPYQAAE